MNITKIDYTEFLRRSLNDTINCHDKYPQNNPSLPLLNTFDSNDCLQSNSLSINKVFETSTIPRGRTTDSLCGTKHLKSLRFSPLIVGSRTI